MIKADQVSVDNVKKAPEPAATADGTPNAPAATDAKPPPVGKRAPGTKEVIPFQWKLLGDAHGMILTLFKAVERDEVESQLTRAQREGYYKNLRIVGADEKIPQPRTHAAERRPAKGSATPKGAAPSSKKRVTTGNGKQAARSTTTGKSSKKPGPRAKTSSKKSTRKSAGATPKKTARRRTAKKK